MGVHGVGRVEGEVHVGVHGVGRVEGEVYVHVSLQPA